MLGSKKLHELLRRSKASDTVLMVGDAKQHGSVEARIRGRSVEIQGAVKGDVEAQREVVLRAGSRLHGNVKAPSFIIERGAFFNGRTEMYRPQAVVRERTDATATPETKPASA